MATPSNNFIRVRLYFDYAPPAVADCRMCWLLVDLNKCRVVADLESIIRDKFEFSRRNILNLFLEDCYLPHTESIYVVRDNDSLRVKVDCLTQVNGHSSHPDISSENCRKRQRPTEEDVPGENGVNVKKKRKKKSQESPEGDAKQTSGDEKNKSSLGNKTEKKKRKKTEETAAPKPAASTKRTPARVEQPVKSTKKPPVAPAKTQNASSSDSSSSSSSEEEDEAPKKPAAKKPATKTPSSTITAASKAPPNIKPAQTKLHPPSSSSSSSSSDTDSSSDEPTSAKIPPKTKPLTSPTPKLRGSDISKSQQSINGAQKKGSSVATHPHNKAGDQPCDTNEEEEEIEFIIRRPVQQLGRGFGNQSSWRGQGRGRGRLDGGGAGVGGGPGGRGRGRGEGRGGFRGHGSSSEFSYDGAKEPSYHTDSLSNTSMLFQNGVESVPKKDYSSMPLLASPPQVGQRIAFKLLELTENYTPEVSEYKEGKILSFDLTTKQIELELVNASRAPVEPGKFDLVYQNPDGSERVEYAVTRGSCVTERWDALLEPRLII